MLFKKITGVGEAACVSARTLQGYRFGEITAPWELGERCVDTECAHTETKDSFPTIAYCLILSVSTVQDSSLSFPGVITVYEKAWVEAPVMQVEGWSSDDELAAVRARCVSLVYALLSDFSA